MPLLQYMSLLRQVIHAKQKFSEHARRFRFRNRKKSRACGLDAHSNPLPARVSTAQDAAGRAATAGAGEQGAKDPRLARIPKGPRQARHGGDLPGGAATRPLRDGVPESSRRLPRAVPADARRIFYVQSHPSDRRRAARSTPHTESGSSRRAAAPLPCPVRASPVKALRRGTARSARARPAGSGSRW